MKSDLLTLSRQLNPLPDPWARQLAHTPSMPWLIQQVFDQEQLAEWEFSEIYVTSLEPYGEDTWQVLQASPRFDAASVLDVMEKVTYDAAGHMAFKPLAWAQTGSRPNLELESSASDAELEKMHQKFFEELISGRLRFTPEDRKTLGSGYNDVFNERLGASSLSLAAIEVSNETFLLGWCWSWHPNT